MKQAIGGATVINIIIIFIVIIFALLAATFSYAKAYKVNTRIMNGIEIFEGYNEGAKKYINNLLGSLGYTKGAKKDCPSKLTLNNQDGVLSNLGTEDYRYCVYYFDEKKAGNCYYSYAVVTYIGFDLPIAGRFEIPVKSKTNRIFNFTKQAYSECSR